MTIEFEQAPDCCKKSIERISEILETGKLLEVVIALSPKMTKPRIKVSKWSILWDFGTGVWSYPKK